MLRQHPNKKKKRLGILMMEDFQLTSKELDMKHKSFPDLSAREQTLDPWARSNVNLVVGAITAFSGW
jgi:hypothetical protein